MNPSLQSLPVVLIPGFMLDSALWRDFLPLITKVMPTLACVPTHGETLHGMADALLKECPDECILIGFSMGGYIAREMAALAPERIKGLVLVASSLRDDTPQQRAAKALALDAVRQNRAFRGMSKSALKASLHPTHCTEAMLTHLHDMGIRLGKDVFIRQSMLERTATAANTVGIICPVLVIAAENDALRSLEEAKELAETLPNTQLEIISHSGHMIPLEQPEALLETMRAWLSNNYPWH